MHFFKADHVKDSDLEPHSISWYTVSNTWPKWKDKMGSLLVLCRPKERCLSLRSTLKFSRFFKSLTLTTWSFFLKWVLSKVFSSKQDWVSLRRKSKRNSSVNIMNKFLFTFFSIFLTLIYKLFSSLKSIKPSSVLLNGSKAKSSSKYQMESDFWILKNPKSKPCQPKNKMHKRTN